jgi:predicted phage gp36 major capsid-like protein
VVADDDRAVRERLAALEAEVKADADAQRARKEAAMDKLRAHQQEQVELRRRQAELHGTQKRLPAARKVEREHDDDNDDGSDLGGALELAHRANRVKNELQKAPKQGDKSWVKSGLASALLGPVGWLYAGSWREAVPAAVAYVALGTLALKILPMLLLWPVFMIGLPLSGIAGVVYALQYNKKGSRQRLFQKDQAKQLKSGGREV